MNSIPYKLIRAKRKTLALVIREDGTLEVRAPSFYPVESIERFIAEKQSWVTKKRSQILARPKAPAHEFVEGEYFPYRGKDYPLLFSDKAKQPYIGSALVFPARSRKSLKRALMRWYRSEAERVITHRVAELSRKFGFSYQSVSINSAGRRWGSCNSRGALNFTYRLIMASDDLIDFVILHELCHTVHQNHSSSFYDALRIVLPDHEERNRRLKTIARSLAL